MPTESQGPYGNVLEAMVNLSMGIIIDRVDPTLVWISIMMLTTLAIVLSLLPNDSSES